MSSAKRRKLLPRFKVWLSLQGGSVIGKGGAEILKAIHEERSIAKAARKLDMSYRYIWGYLNRIRETTGKPVVKSRRGGLKGGGETELTKFGMDILKDYERLEKSIIGVLKEPEYWERLSVKISARNRLKGTVEDVKKDPVAAEIRIKVESPIKITAVITREAIEELKIKPGDKVEAVIKATEVLIGKTEKHA